MSGLTFGGVDLGGSTYGLALMGVPSTMHGMADSKRTTIDTAGDGAVAFVGGVKNSRLTIECAIATTSAANTRSQLDLILGVLDPRNGVQLLSLAFDTTRSYYAVLDGPVYPIFYPTGCTFQLYFLIPSGKAVAPTATARTAVDVTAAVYEPSSAAAVVAGNTAAHPVWTVKNTGAVATGVTMTNVTTGQVCTWTGALATNAWLRLNAETVLVERSLDSGTTWTTVTSGLTGAQVPLTLRAGARNQITIAGLTAGTADFTYRAEYL